MKKSKKLISSYKKLKLENEKLKQDIYNLVRNENTHEGIITKARYSLQYECEDVMMFGTREIENKEGIFDGVIAYLK